MKTFPRGGVHPSDNKLSRAEAVEVLTLPDVVNVPLSQHIGAPAVAKVAKGDKVKVGELIAEAAGFVSANIHAPVSGTVTGVDMLPNGQGIRQMMITIRREGDEWAEGIDTSKELVRECTLSAPEILARIKEAGIVGMGGAAFPTQVKLTVPAGKKVEHLIINGVECEPYLTSDHRVMLERSEELLVGVTILMRALGVSGASVGIENNKPDAITRLSRLASSYPGIRVVPLRVRYPQGGEKQLIAAVTGREVPPPPGLPIDVGAVVCNVSTTEAAGGVPAGDVKVLNGGPMMGRAMSNLASPVVKGCSGITVLGGAAALRGRESSCIKCAKCVSACPMGLEPYLMAKLSRRKLWERLEAEWVTNCIECGCCQFTCPADIPLLDFIRMGKQEVGALIRARAAAHATKK